MSTFAIKNIHSEIHTYVLIINWNCAKDIRSVSSMTMFAFLKNGLQKS